MKISPTQRRVLKYIAKHPYATPIKASATLGTWKALARRKLIYVATTFASVSYPLSAAEAVITDEGRAALDPKRTVK